MVRLPCETCQSEHNCALRAEFMPRFFHALFEDPPSCREYDPRWYRGIEGCLQ